MTVQDLVSVKEFTDEFIGMGYFSLRELQEIHTLSCKDELCSSFLAAEGEKLLGIRLSYAPGKWVTKARGLSLDKWSVSPQRVGHFKSLFVHTENQGQGIGHKLSSTSIECLKLMGAEGVVCHSWLESPGNSSQNYLKKMGFKTVAEHPMFWSTVDYICTRCGKGTCQCTASEMILYF